MKVLKLLCLAALAALTACGGALGKLAPPPEPVGESYANTGSEIEAVTKDGTTYHLERSAGHPAICWAVGPNRLGAIMNNVADIISYGDIHALEQHRYRFLSECEGIATLGDPKFGLEHVPVTFRTFEYADQNTPFLLRDVDMNGRKFRNYVVVASYQRPTGNHSHWIHQRENDAADIKYCVDIEEPK